VTVGLGVAAGGLGVVAVSVGAGVADGAVLPRGAAVAGWRPDGEADGPVVGGAVVGGAGTAGRVAEWVVDWPEPPTCAAGSGRTSR
jgi:hypothetical protein